MKPVTVSVRVNRPREEVFAFLDVLANHASFTDHMLVDWSFEGPPAGVGAKARLRAKAAGQSWMVLEVLAAQPPVSTVEETVGANGGRRTRGTYTLAELPDGGTDIQFKLEWLEVPRAERLAAPLIRAQMKQANAKAMRRLAQTLERPEPRAATLPPPQPAA
jgi:Polyketide cyclase / dehydrase and lipid transport